MIEAFGFESGFVGVFSFGGNFGSDLFLGLTEALVDLFVTLIELGFVLTLVLLDFSCDLLSCANSFDGNVDILVVTEGSIVVVVAVVVVGASVVVVVVDVVVEVVVIDVVVVVVVVDDVVTVVVVVDAVVDFEIGFTFLCFNFG